MGTKKEPRSELLIIIHIIGQPQAVAPKSLTLRTLNNVPLVKTNQGNT